ncbi:modular serine protease-like [Schistocerca serialis cubense]|uniref:modular serine protease-like n=1 Tax=Schistocerca serialis cubense TaxID=2023355 RepID=UPI00214E53AD|nr:modular serine protease-like [Schistocerca serialis cubense]
MDLRRGQLCALSLLLTAFSSIAENSVSRVKRQDCGTQNFQCQNGECIEHFKICDGTADCSDKSDENKVTCRWRRCSSDAFFRCAYGACVDVNAACDGTIQCEGDGSDEAPELCGTSPALKCTLPLKHKNGGYKVIGCDSQFCGFAPGAQVPSGTQLEFFCDEGYHISGPNDSYCLDEAFTPPPPVCEKNREYSTSSTLNHGKCPSLASESIYAECFYGESRFTCDWAVLPGTRAVVDCRFYYTSANRLKQNLTCGHDGRWNSEVKKCNPACGMVRPQHIPLIAGGEAVQHREFPWHVAIYKNVENIYKYICGGSLISLKYVLSSAICFWNNAKYVKYPEELFRVIAGKFHSSYTTKDPGQQERAVRAIDIPQSFLGSATAFRDDIAVLTVDFPFQLTEMISPVCVDWDDVYDVGPGDKGHVAGWGVTETGEPSEELRSAEFPVIAYNECLKTIKPNYRIYFGHDKICAGHRNGTTACRGDSGGGLTFIHEINPLPPSSKSYFVQGIVSANGRPSRRGACNLEDYVAFTKVSEFRSFLNKYRE